MTFLTEFLEKNDSENIIIDPIQIKIEHMIIKYLNIYEQIYNMELFRIYKNWKHLGKKFTFSELNQEAHRRTGVKKFKKNITKKIWLSIKNDIDKEVKSRTTSKVIIQQTKLASKKDFAKMVSVSVNDGLKEISKKAQAKSINNSIIKKT